MLEERIKEIITSDFHTHASPASPYLTQPQLKSLINATCTKNNLSSISELQFSQIVEIFSKDPLPPNPILKITKNDLVYNNCRIYNILIVPTMEKLKKSVVKNFAIVDKNTYGLLKRKGLSKLLLALAKELGLLHDLTQQFKTIAKIVDVGHEEKISLADIEQKYSYIYSILYYQGSKAQIKNFEFLKQNVGAGVEEGNPHFIKNLGLKLTITHAIAKETGSKGRRRSSTNLIAQNLMHFGFKEANFNPGPGDNEIDTETSSESVYSKSSDAISSHRMSTRKREKRTGLKPGDQ